jgi:glycosyltransferase involved in cell wall biosynthesis
MAVVYIGSITRSRGILELVEGMSLLPSDTPLRLKLAGTFSPAELQDDMHTLPGWERVDYLGFLRRGQVTDLLGRVRAGLLVLHPEETYLCSMPIKLFEYMAAEIPVIASDFPLWRQIIEEARCGLLVDPLNPVAIAAAIERLYNHPAEAEQMGKRGRAAVESRYTWAGEERRLKELYESLVGHPAAADPVPAIAIHPHLSTHETS